MCLASAAPVLAAVVAAHAQTGTAIVTEHYDYMRTSWNSTETVLTPQVLAASNNGFGLRVTVALDQTVDAQPLVVPNQNVACGAYSKSACRPGAYEVVYVVTENNTVYAINSASGAILMQRNFGPTDSIDWGIRATPFADLVSGHLYFFTFRKTEGDNTIRLHSINLDDLTDAAARVDVDRAKVSSEFASGTEATFMPGNEKERTALLLVNGTIYAGFASKNENRKRFVGPGRGWLVAFDPATLAVSGTSFLTNKLSTSQDNDFLSSIWMSGSGIVADGDGTGAQAGYLYFATGNSDPCGCSYDEVNNIANSVVKISPDLSTVVDIFTPSNESTMDKYDEDLGAGGVMKIPPQGGNFPSLLVAGGKDGRLFLLDANNLGGYTPGGTDKVLGVETQGGCWCAPSYFMGPEGIGRVVSSGGNTVITWKLINNGASTLLTEEASAAIQSPNSGQDPGFFTTVSSNGNGPNENAIIWAVSRPSGVNNTVYLYAINAAPLNGTLPLLGQYAAGQWNLTRDANIKPVVANGQVFVASDHVLTIFGLPLGGAPKP